MKKTYIQPTTEVVKIHAPQLLYTSQVRQGNVDNPTPEDDEWLDVPDTDGRLWGD